MNNRIEPSNGLDQDAIGPVGGPEVALDRTLNVSLRITFGIFLFSSTFSIAISQIALGLSLGLYLVIALKTKQPFMSSSLRPISILIAAYVGWLALSSLAGNTPIASLLSLREEWLFAALPIAFFAFQGDRAPERMLPILATGLCLITTYGIIQHFTAVNWFRDAPVSVSGGLVRLSGNFSHPLTYGNFIVTATLFALGYSIKRYTQLTSLPRLIYIITSLTGLVAISLLNSRGPMLAAVAGLLFLALMARRIRYLLPVLIGGLLISIILSPGLVDVFSERFEHDLESTDPASRLYIWRNTLKIIGDNPVFGVGPGNFADAYSQQAPPTTEPHRSTAHAHSDYLNIAAVAGLPGLLAYLAIWILILSGFLGITLADTLFFYSLNLVGVGLVSIVDCLYSPFIILFSWLILLERLTLLQYLGAGMILLAVYITSGHAPPKDRTRGQLILGIFLGVPRTEAVGTGRSDWWRRIRRR